MSGRGRRVRGCKGSGSRGLRGRPKTGKQVRSTCSRSGDAIVFAVWLVVDSVEREGLDVLAASPAGSQPPGGHAQAGGCGEAVVRHLSKTAGVHAHVVKAYSIANDDLCTEAQRGSLVVTR